MWERFRSYNYREFVFETEEDKIKRQEADRKISVNNTKSSKKYDRKKFRGR
jgi:hypothetical protein